MMTNSTIIISADEDLKRKAEKYFEQRGTTLEIAVHLFILNQLGTEENYNNTVEISQLEDGEVPQYIWDELEKIKTEGTTDYFSIT